MSESIYCEEAQRAKVLWTRLWDVFNIVDLSIQVEPDNFIRISRLHTLGDLLHHQRFHHQERTGWLYHDGEYIYTERFKDPEVDLIEA